MVLCSAVARSAVLRCTTRCFAVLRGPARSCAELRYLVGRRTVLRANLRTARHLRKVARCYAVLRCAMQCFVVLRVA
jgi:hypothetical protein